MSLVKLIATRMVGRVGNRMVGAPVKSGSAVAPAQSQVHRGAPLPRPATLPREPDLAAQLRALPPPPPSPALPPVVPSAGWRGSCKAICADTGRQCRLPAHGGTAHRHERGPFFRTADPSQTTFRAREQLDAAATRRSTTNPEAP